MRSRTHRAIVIALASAALISGTARRSEATFMFVSESAILDPVSGSVNFTLEFNQAPDFFTVDEVGRPINSFQYYFHDSLARGAEIPLEGDLRIRSYGPPDPDPAAGGWGEIRDSVPIHLTGTVLTFSIPLALVADANGKFRDHPYWMQTLEYGRTTRVTTIVPEPGTVMLLLVGGLVSVYRRRRS